MNATDSLQASSPARRWQIWWLAVPLVPLSVFAAVVGFDSLQAQQPLQIQQPNPRPYNPAARDAFAPGPDLRPSTRLQRPAPPADAPFFNAPTPVDPARELANTLRRLDPQSDDYDSKRATLDKTVAEQFDRRHQQQQRQLEEAEKRLAKLQQDLERRAEAKDQIVARRIIELLGEADPLRWESAPLNTLPPYPGRTYTAPAGASQAASGTPARDLPESVRADDIHFYATPVPYPNPFNRQTAPVAPGSRTFAPVTTPAAGAFPTAKTVPPPAASPPAVSLPAVSLPAVSLPAAATQEANRVAGELARCIQEINAKQVELRRLQQLYRRGAIPQAEPVRLAAEVDARRQQQKLLELQLDQLAEQTKLNIQHARQTLENAEKRLQVAQEPLDDSNPTSLRQQQRDIAEAETKLLQALQQMASVEQQGEYLKRLRDGVGKVNQQEWTQPEDTEDSPDAEEAGDAVAY